MDGDDHARGHAVLPFERGVEISAARLALAALRHDRGRPAYAHEFLEAQPEAFLVAVGRDGAAGILRLCQRLQPALAYPFGPGDLGEIGLPGFEPRAGIAAGQRGGGQGGKRQAESRHETEQVHGNLG